MKSLEPVAIDEPPGVESLLDGELAVLVRFVRALVDHDEPALGDSEDEHPVRKFVERGIVEATLAARWGIRRNLETYVRATSANRGHAPGR